MSHCGTETEHITDICFLAETTFFKENPGSRIIVHTATSILFLLSAGFAFPVLNLFILQLRNILAGQTSIERLGKQGGRKVSLETLYNVNEPLLEPITEQIETKFLYREMVRDARTKNNWRSQGI